MTGTGSTPTAFDALAGFAAADLGPVFAAFRRMAEASAADQPVLRPALAPESALRSVMAAALALPPEPTPTAARHFVTTRFTAHRLSDEAFFTGYYEPVVDGALDRSESFAAPILARPDDLVTFAAEALRSAGLEHLAAARRMPDGTLVPYPDRAAIEAVAIEGGVRPLVWLRDWVEVFLIQVQGSARVRLADGRLLRLTYAGRNGHPYTSIGRLLVEAGAIPAAAMSLERLKAWLRAGGQAPGEPGRALMQRNASYIFFAATEDGSDDGPIGGAGLPLTPLVSIAVDRTCWCYGLPFWVDVVLPWESDTATPLRRLMLAEDTGSAIVGPARVDLFMGSGAAAGRRAGGIRHRGALTVLRPGSAGA